MKGPFIKIFAEHLWTDFTEAIDNFDLVGDRKRVFISRKFEGIFYTNIYFNILFIYLFISVQNQLQCVLKSLYDQLTTFGEVFIQLDDANILAAIIKCPQPTYQVRDSDVPLLLNVIYIY